MKFTGILEVEDIPRDCVSDCARPGQRQFDVGFWRDHLDFTIESRESAVKGLMEYGAWEEEELDNKSDTDLAEIILWLACGDFWDGENTFCLY